MALKNRHKRPRLGVPRLTRPSRPAEARILLSGRRPRPAQSPLALARRRHGHDPHHKFALRLKLLALGCLIPFLFERPGKMQGRVPKGLGLPSLQMKRPWPHFSSQWRSHRMVRKRQPWRVSLKESVIDDLLWFGKKTGRLLLDEAERELAADPLTSTRNIKTLRPNRVAHVSSTARSIPRSVQRRRGTTAGHSCAGWRKTRRNAGCQRRGVLRSP